MTTADTIQHTQSQVRHAKPGTSRRARRSPFAAILTTAAAACLALASHAVAALQPGQVIPTRPHRRPTKCAHRRNRHHRHRADHRERAVVVEFGRITQVGPASDVSIPYDATEYDVEGMFVFPGMIDPHSSSGLDVPNENVDVAPFLDVYDAIDPSQLFFENSLRDGVTSVHIMQGNNTVIGGLSRVVRPIGLSVDEMTVRPGVALKMSTTPKGGFDRMRQLATLRNAFIELDNSLERLAETVYERSRKDRNLPVDVVPAEARKRGRDLIKEADYEDSQRNLVRLRRGDLSAWIYCGRATDVAPALAIAEAQGFLERTVLVIATDAYKASHEIAAAGRPVVLTGGLFHRETDPITGQLRETFVPGILRDAGITFAVEPSRGASFAERYPNYLAAVMTRHGIPRADALRAITINPAEILGMADQIGSIDTGKRGNLVVLGGDPLDFNSWVELVFIDGILAYDRRQDHRLQRLLELDPLPEPTPQPQTPQPQQQQRQQQRRRPQQFARHKQQQHSNGNTNGNANGGTTGDHPSPLVHNMRTTTWSAAVPLAIAAMLALLFTTPEPPPPLPLPPPSHTQRSLTTPTSRARPSSFAQQQSTPATGNPSATPCSSSAPDASITSATGTLPAYRPARESSSSQLASSRPESSPRPAPSLAAQQQTNPWPPRSAP